jgi:uracil-DNA glycosylase
MWKWSELNYWKSGEWQVVEERINDEIDTGVRVCPSKKNLFAALVATPFNKVRVCIVGQDPYPDGRFATGIAFSIPKGQENFPPTLCNVYSELCSDLGVAYPRTGELSRWTKQGVLLWNAIPSCREGHSASHHWDEWSYLTREIVERLDEKSVVFVLLGRIARSYRRYITRSPCIETSHPSPLGAAHGFLGSRIFSQVNSHLPQPIDWSLP